MIDLPSPKRKHAHFSINFLAFLIALQVGEADFLGSTLSQSSLIVYFDRKTSIPSRLSWLEVQRLLIVFLKLNPPTHLGRQSLSHFFQAIKLPSFSLGFHQNLLEIESNLSPSLVGMLIEDRV